MHSKINERGFTLVEIMIVVAIIGLLAAIAIPNLLRVRMSANEGTMKSELRAFSSASESYRAAQIPMAYAPDVVDLTSAVPPYLDNSWETMPKHGFNLSYSADTTTFSMLASPATSTDAASSFCVDQTGVVVSGETGVSGAVSGCSGGLPIP